MKKILLIPTLFILVMMLFGCKVKTSERLPLSASTSFDSSKAGKSAKVIDNVNLTLNTAALPATANIYNHQDIHTPGPSTTPIPTFPRNKSAVGSPADEATDNFFAGEASYNYLPYISDDPMSTPLATHTPTPPNSSWAFEETFDLDPSAPSQIILPQNFDF
ncbi:MAG: hypothetical protein ACK2TV_15530, partial [Anaerolineales bacterium]